MNKGLIDEIKKGIARKTTAVKISDKTNSFFFRNEIEYIPNKNERTSPFKEANSKPNTDVKGRFNNRRLKISIAIE